MKPPLNITKEMHVVWTGWSKMGNREVVRESAAKGAHIELAFTFLSQRQNQSKETIKSWFKAEVFEWIRELLHNKQIFRASHILKHLQLDPMIEFHRILLQTTDIDMRAFLSEHLEKHECLDEDTKLNLTLLNLIRTEDDILKMLSLPETSTINVQVLIDCDKQLKQVIAAKLFLKYYDYSIVSLLDTEILWICALEQQQRQFIEIWLEMQYSHEETEIIDDDLKELLRKHHISETMLHTLQAKQVSDEMIEFVFDVTSKYGIFALDELCDVEKILKRMEKHQLLENMSEILSRPHTNLPYAQFKQILHNYCVEKQYFTIIDSCFPFETSEIRKLTSDQNLELEILESCNKVASNLNDYHTLSRNLELIQRYLNEPSSSAVLDLFRLSLTSLNLHSHVLNHQNELVMPQLVTIAKKFVTKPMQSNLNHYNLLSKHLHIEVEDIFSCPLKNGTFPHFKQEEIVQAYGYQKKVDYIFYILQSRPLKAVDHLKAQSFNEAAVKAKIRKVAIKNVENEDVVMSCISFLEILHIDTGILRFELKALRILIENQNISHAEACEMLLLQEWDKLIGIIEEGFMKLFKSEHLTFTQSLQYLEGLVKMAREHNLDLPLLYLQDLATNSKWLEFLIIIQLFNYSYDQFSPALGCFKNEAFFDHLSHALAHDLVYEPKNSRIKDRDARKFFLAKIGVLKPMIKSASLEMNLSIASASSWGSTTSSSSYSDYVVEVDSCQSEQSLLQILSKCHNSNDPPKALLYACQRYTYPLFAVLATTYEPDSVITCWLTWLEVSCGMHIENIDKLAVSGALVNDFLIAIVRKGCCKTLKQSFLIFLKENPLRHFVEFLCSCQNLPLEMNSLQEDLEHFNTKMKFKRSNSYVTEIVHEMLYLNNKLWIENAAVAMLADFLTHRLKSYARIQLLHVLIDLDLQRYFFQRLPNLDKLYRLLTHFYDKSINIIDLEKLFDAASYCSEIQRCIKFLLADGKYEEALQIAQLEDTLVDEVLLDKWVQPHKDFQTEEHWSHCDAEFRNYEITPSKAIRFYQNLSQTTSATLKYNILSLAYQWASHFDADCRYSLEQELWETYLNLPSVVNVPLQIETEKCQTYSEFNVDLIAITKQNKNFMQLNEENIQRLDEVCIRLLDSGSVYQALRMNMYFPSYNNNNLDILKLCYSLAEGITLPILLTAKERLLIHKGKQNRSYSHRKKPLLSFRLSNSVSRSPASSTFGSSLDIEPNVQDTLSLLETLTDGLTSGIEIGERIVMRYRLCTNTDLSYNQILSIDDSISLLRRALASNCLNQIEIVRDFFAIYDWPKENIADFLCEQLITTVAESVKAHEESIKMWNVHLGDEIHIILQLLPDCCTLLGNKLYAYCSALHKAQTITNDTPELEEIANVVELLILSHSCFTADCNMEGISIILKKCQTLLNLLLTLKNWPLIVRLLTGIGRYNELHYVFHILREHDQFEYLLRKGNAKDHALRVALLDYLKKFCPDNRDLYEMVALYFSLYSEVAQIWENEAQHQIRNLIAISKLEMLDRKINPDECIFVELSNTEGTKICLQKTMENYTHAAEYHLQGEKLAKSMNAARQAEVIALQFAMVKELNSNETTKCILNLSTLQISALLSDLSFHQAIIITEAYQHQPDWAAALFDHFIINNEHDYLESYLITYNLTDNVAHSISRHYLLRNVTSEQGIKNMKSILKLLPSIHTKYRIVSELGFTDMIEELLRNDQLIYLKDTVWKRGYRE